MTPIVIFKLAFVSKDDLALATFEVVSDELCLVNSY
jgi:hypothetical protein